MTILVAGATGLAGSAIVRELTRIGKPVVGISSKDVDLLDRNATLKYLTDLKPKVVIDSAAKVGGVLANSSYPVEFLSKNIQIQTNLMDASHNARVEKFIFLASSCVYPRICPQPIKEEFLLTGPFEPTTSAYAIAKIAGMELIKSYRREFGHKWISVIPANLYGPNDNFNLDSSHVLPSLIRKFIDSKNKNSSEVILWGGGSQTREFLYVDDLAKAIMICLEEYDGDQHINIGTGEEISISNLASLIANKTGYQGRISWDLTKPEGTPRKVLEISKLRSLGWKPTVSLEVGISSTINWYKQNKR
jgi:GDP-L-fucose synthase